MFQSRSAALWFLLFFAGHPVAAGVYLFAPGLVSPQDPFIVVHPPGYDGENGGQLFVRVCAPVGLERMAPAIAEAIELWNGLVPTTENCSNCVTWEEDPSILDAKLSMSSVIAHEMGHCIMGLDHANWFFGGVGPDEESSFTNAADATVITVGIDGIRGTADDEVTPLPGADLIHWFRKADNDPFVIDSTVVDISTYTRRILDIMALGDNWPANANRVVGESMGLMNTHALMYSGQALGQTVHSLTADEVNTVAFGMAGMDEVAGTADDYSVNIIFEGADCANAEVEIIFSDQVPDGVLGDCENDIEALPGGGLFDIHHVIIPSSRSRIQIRVNSDLSNLWDVVFADGFESGGTTIWSEVLP